MYRLQIFSQEVNPKAAAFAAASILFLDEWSASLYYVKKAEHAYFVKFTFHFGAVHNFFKNYSYDCTRYNEGGTNMDTYENNIPQEENGQSPQVEAAAQEPQPTYTPW